MAALDDVIAQYLRKRGLQKTLSAFAEESQFKDCKKVKEDLENIYSYYLSNKEREVADAPSSMRKSKKDSADAVIANGESDGTGKETKKKGRKVKNIEKKSSEEKIESEGNEAADAPVVTSGVAVETVAGDRTEPDPPAIQEADHQNVDEPPPSKKKKGKKAKSETDLAKESDNMDVDDEKKKLSADESNGALKQEPPSKQKKGKKADKSKGKEPVEIAEGDHGTVEMEVDAKKGSEAQGLLDASNESSKKKKKKGGDTEVKAEVVGHETGSNVAVEQVADANSKKKKGKKEKTELPANGKDPVDSEKGTKLEADSEKNYNANSEQEVSKKKKGKKNTEKETKEPAKEADENPVTEEKSGQKRKRKNKEETEEVAEGDVKTAAKAFQRVKPDEVEFLDPRLQDNSYWAKDGAEVGWGAKAQEVLGQVKGRGFRHEKTKKKRGSYKGGAIDLQSHSIKFDNDDSSS